MDNYWIYALCYRLRLFKYNYEFDYPDWIYERLKEIGCPSNFMFKEANVN